MNRTLTLWSTATGEVVASWPRKLAPQGLAFSADNGTLAVLPGGEAESLSLLDVVTGKEQRQLKFEGGGRDNIRLRRFRAMHTLSQQIQARTAHFEQVGQILLGMPPEEFL